MAKFRVASAVFCILLINYNLCNGSMLSWITGTRTTTLRPDTLGGHGQVPSLYTEESGECSHWGNAGQSQYQYPTNDPMSQGYQYNGGAGAVMPGELVGSHRSLPVGTIVAVTNLRTGNTARVRVVSPRTIPVFGRVMDLSPTAFSQVASLAEGVFTCSVRILEPTRTVMDSLTSHTFDNRYGVRPTRPSLVTSYSPDDDVKDGRLGLLGSTSTSQYGQVYPPIPNTNFQGSNLPYSNVDPKTPAAYRPSMVTAYNPEDYR